MLTKPLHVSEHRNALIHALENMVFFFLIPILVLTCYSAPIPHLQGMKTMCFVVCFSEVRYHTLLL